MWNDRKIIMSENGFVVDVESGKPIGVIVTKEIVGSMDFSGKDFVCQGCGKQLSEGDVVSALDPDKNNCICFQCLNEVAQIGDNTSGMTKLKTVDTFQNPEYWTQKILLDIENTPDSYKPEVLKEIIYDSVANALNVWRFDGHMIARDGRLKEVVDEKGNKKHVPAGGFVCIACGKHFDNISDIPKTQLCCDLISEAIESGEISGEKTMEDIKKELAGKN